MWHVKADTVPDSDTLAGLRRDNTFRDALSVPLNAPDKAVDQIQLAIFSHMPAWVNYLMNLRDRLVARLGFNTGDRISPDKDLQALRPGDKAGFLEVMSLSDSEIISSAEDKHMHFFLSVSKQNNRAVVSTMVNPKTRTGWLYLQLIRPFHWFIARAVIEQAYRKKRI